MDKENILFDDRKWFEKIKYSLFSYMVIKEYIDDDSLFEFIDTETYLHSEHEIDNAILNAKSIHAQQAIALFCSYVEEIIKDLAFVILEKNPSLQKDSFLNKSPLEGYDLKKGIESDFRMPIKEKLKWFENVSKKDLSLECKIEMKKAFNLKTTIVNKKTHHTEDLEVSIDYYYDILGVMLIKGLGDICDAMNIDRTNKEFEEAGATDSLGNSDGVASNIIRFPPKL